MNKKTSVLIFNRKNLITCINVSFYRLLYEYICWALAGKPESHTPELEEGELNSEKTKTKK